MNEQQMSSPIVRVGPASEESKRMAATVQEMKSQQLQFLDEAGKSIIERVSTFLTVFFAITILGNTFPPPYLKGNIGAKALVVITLMSFLVALGAAVVVIQPRAYKYREDDVEDMRSLLQGMVQYKAFWLRWAQIAFALAALLLVVLIVALVVSA